MTSAENKKLEEDRSRQKNWKRWGPYLSLRQWGTVREDYSSDGSCWDYFTHDHARSRAYRWGEDGLLGITDRECRLCFSIALWNEKDSILKERLFGLTGPEGNHGEDVKECYYFLDNSPTHSYMKALYKYPIDPFPYHLLLEENQRRSKIVPEYELLDTGIFNNDRFFDIFIEYAKNSPNDILIKITAINRSATPAPLHIIPTVWFRNTWSWGRSGEGYTTKPDISLLHSSGFITNHPTLGKFELRIDNEKSQPLFTDNETNYARLFKGENPSKYVKDAFHDYIVDGIKNAVSPDLKGTKAAFHNKHIVPPHTSYTLKLRLSHENEKPSNWFGNSFDSSFEKAIAEYKEFYSTILPANLNSDESAVMKQAYGGLLWSKQFYYYSVSEWLEGDPTQPTPASSRKDIRNSDWGHLYNRDIISMPDNWEYPWYAAWDLAFHMLPMAELDPDFAKDQLLLFLREWYMHPNGQMPAYEFAFSDVNPPVHAWAVWRTYKITAPRGQRDVTFLARAFHKLLLNFTWWVNRKDLTGKHLFSGGFLGLDNIGVFDRSRPLPTGGHLEQADGTAWMAFYCATMLSMALELAHHDKSYEDIASKFFEHFVAITSAINTIGGTGLWNTEDGFYYDQLHSNGSVLPLKVRSMVGIIPIFAVEFLEYDILKALPGFAKRMEWFIDHKPHLASHITDGHVNGDSNHQHKLLAVPSKEQLAKLLSYVFSEDEFLSPYGIRSLSKIHLNHPFSLNVGSEEYKVEYSPGESTSGMFGGNSNWRGPVWFPLNYLLIEALERYHHFYGDSFKIDYPTGSGNKLNLKQISQDLSRRLSKLFLKDSSGRRPCHGTENIYLEPYWRDQILFYEYFHGDTGRGAGASHQTGWTALVTRCLSGKR